MRFDPEVARAHQEGRAGVAFLSSAADVGPSRRASTWGRRLAARPEPSTLEGVFLWDPFCLEFMPLSLPTFVVRFQLDSNWNCA